MTSIINFRCMSKNQINTLSYLLRDEKLEQFRFIDDIQNNPTKDIAINNNNIHLTYLKSCMILSIYKYFDFIYYKIYPDGRYEHIYK